MSASSPAGSVRLVSPLLPGLIGLMALIQLAFPYRGWMIMLVGLGGAWLLGRLWARSLQHGLSLDREARFQWSQVGDRMLERLTLANTSPFPAPWVELIDQSSGPLTRRSRAFGIGRRTSLRWHEQLVCRQRGRFVLGPTRLRTSDPFGLYAVDIELPETASLLVLPPVVPWDSLPVFSRGRAEEGRTVHALDESSVSASQVRPYAPGDSLRRIHWPTSARLGELYIRQFDRATQGDWLILLDSDYRHFRAVESDPTFEDCVILAASLAEYGFGQGRSVGLLGGGPTGPTWIPPRQGEAQRWALLAGLAEVQRGLETLDDFISLGSGRLGRQASLIIITPSNRRQDFDRLLASSAGRGAASAGVVFLDTGEPARQQATRQAAGQLQRHGFPTWIVGQADLHEQLRQRAEAPHPGPDSGSWRRVA